MLAQVPTPSVVLLNRGGQLRDKATINRLKMYRGGKPIRDKKGKVGLLS